MEKIENSNGWINYEIMRKYRHQTFVGGQVIQIFVTKLYVP